MTSQQRLTQPDAIQAELRRAAASGEEVRFLYRPVGAPAEAGWRVRRVTRVTGTHFYAAHRRHGSTTYRLDRVQAVEAPGARRPRSQTDSHVAARPSGVPSTSGRSPAQVVLWAAAAAAVIWLLVVNAQDGGDASGQLPTSIDSASNLPTVSAPRSSSTAIRTAPTPRPTVSTPVEARYVGNTGGIGVSLRSDCTDAARIAGGWADGTTLRLVETGSGRCAGWDLMALGTTESWVSARYLLGSSISASTTIVSMPPCASSDCDCADFSSRAQLNSVFSAFPGDPHGLDSDNDGVPCEWGIGASAGTATTAPGQFIPYAGNGGGPTQCNDGTWSHSSGRGTCSHHGGVR